MTTCHDVTTFLLFWTQAWPESTKPESCYLVKLWLDSSKIPLYLWSWSSWLTLKLKSDNLHVSLFKPGPGLFWFRPTSLTGSVGSKLKRSVVWECHSWNQAGTDNSWWWRNSDSYMTAPYPLPCQIHPSGPTLWISRFLTSASDVGSAHQDLSPEFGWVKQHYLIVVI